MNHLIRGGPVRTGLLLLTMSVAPALGATAPESGSWTITTTTEREGVIRSMASKTACLTPQDLQDPEMGIAPKPSALRGTCKRARFEKKDNGLSWDIECRGKAVLTTKSSIVFESANHFTGVTQISLSPTAPNRSKFAAVKNLEAQRTGECKP